MRAYLQAMRLERWPRSLAIFIGSASLVFLNRSLLGGEMFSLLLKLGTAFLLTWGISTANYVINEIVDAPYDAHHPTKKDRPLVRGLIKKKPFAALGVLLTLVSLGGAWLLYSPSFFTALLSLLLAGFIYNVRPVRTKDIPFLDSISESANNPIRFLIGWYAIAQADSFPPVLLLLSWWSFGNYLLVAKRLSEFRFLKDKAGDYRSSLKKYSIPSLLLGMAVSAALFFLTYTLFALQFKLQTFLLLIPPLAVFFLFIFRKTLKEKEVMEEPERLLLQPKFALYTLFLALMFLAAILWDRVGR
jgi:decaprenyl-phosphate phosphoribosyltransferase